MAKAKGIDRDGRTELHYAALENDEGQVQRLLREGVDPNSKDHEGFTPLHFAAQEFAVDAARGLLKGGARVDETNEHGNTPLATATFNSNGRGEMIKLLRDAGADPWHSNNYGKTAVSLARLIANFDVAQHFADLPKDPPPRPPALQEVAPNGGAAPKRGRGKKS